MLFKEFQSNKSLLDFLQQLMPGWQGTIYITTKPKTNNKAAKALFALWKNESNIINDKTLKRPTTFPIEDIKLMQSEGLIKHVGEKIEITSKGADVIKTMILGDDKSAFEEDGSVLDFDKAYANTKPRRMMKKAKHAQLEVKNWYKRMQNDSNN